MQPLIAPLYAGRSAHEVLTMLTDQPESSGYDIVKGYWNSQHTGADFEAWWRKAIHDGVVPDTALPAKTAAMRAGWADRSRSRPVRGRWKLFFVPIRRYTTAASPITAGCRNCPGRSPRSPGIMRPS